MKGKILRSSGKFLLLWVVGILLSVQAFAQSMTVKGIVKDNTGFGVIGASVQIKGTTKGAITDLDGNFTLQANKGDIIVISYIGYKTQELPAEENMNILLLEDTEMLDEVVVIGYGSVKKSDLSGSVVAIEAEEINRGAVTSPQELMQGKVPGLSVTSGDGGPGSGSTIRIRSGASLNASNDPLIVIDGVPVDKGNDAAPGMSNALASINPNDIATFTVLKDASATAIYGSRASNGVIIITTKKGTEGKIKVTYNSTYSYKDPYNRLNVMNADEYRTTILNQYAGTASYDVIEGYLNMYPGVNTDWQDAIFQGGLSTDQNIAVSGKAGFLPFRVSFGYNKERGTLKTSDYERYTGAINLSPKFFDDHLSVDINIKGVINNNRYADGSAVGKAAYYDPTKPLSVGADDPFGYNGYFNWTLEQQGADGNPTYAANENSSVNPLSLLYDRNNTSTTKRSLGNLQLDYKIHGFEDLRLNLNLGYDVAKGTQDDYVVPNSFQAAKDDIFPYLGQGSSQSRLRRNHLLDFYANYVHYFEPIKSNVDLMVGYSWQHFYYKDFTQGKSNPAVGEFAGIQPPADSPWAWNEAEQRYYNTDSRPSPWENYLVSFFGRLNYNLMDRYLLTATLRRDGSSRFSENNRWGLFPSVALAWSIINENFMEKSRDVLSNLKLRLGYGITGQQDIGDYMYMANYTLSSSTSTMYNGTYLLKPSGYSPDLKWEQTATYNIGVDYGFLNNRISGSLELYIKQTKDLLNTVSAPAGTNFTNTVTANVGEMKNKGIEFNINAVPIQTKDFSWTIGYNITWNDSEITKLTASFNPDYEGIVAANAPFGTNTPLSRHQVGYAPYTFWLFKQVYDEQGKPIQGAVEDRNGNGTIDDGDRYFTGKSALADFYMGFSSQFQWKNWDLGFNLRASIGNYAFNANNAQNSSLANYGGLYSISNYNKDALDYVGGGFRQRNEVEWQMTDLYLENASYLKMDNITIGYTFDKFFTDKISGRISASVQNVFTITKYTGLDPEVSNINGIDDNMWPRPRTFTLGINLNF